MEGFAHRDGCHRWHSCPSDSGRYVCGDLGHDDECGGNKENTDNDRGTQSQVMMTQAVVTATIMVTVRVIKK